MDRITKALELARYGQDNYLDEDTETTESKDPVFLGRRFSGHARQQVVSPEILQQNRLIAGGDNNVVADAYRLLRTRILNAMRRDGWSVLGITSAGGQEGTSLTAANLAISMAREPNTNVLLVDANLRRPALHRYFGLTVPYGLADYLRSDIPINQVLISPGIERLLILPGGDIEGPSSELITSKKMSDLLVQCKSQSDLGCIIVDLPPVLTSDDTLVLSSHLDAVLLVVDEGRTIANDLIRSLELLDRVRVVGSVLNRSPHQG